MWSVPPNLQVIKPSLLQAGFELVARENLEVTDDVSIIEALGEPVKLTRGSYTNIKVSYSLIALAPKLRVSDSHRESPDSVGKLERFSVLLLEDRGLIQQACLCLMLGGIIAWTPHIPFADTALRGFSLYMFTLRRLGRLKSCECAGNNPWRSLSRWRLHEGKERSCWCCCTILIEFASFAMNKWPGVNV